METIIDIDFQPITIDSVSEIAPLLPLSASRTCDYTLGGLIMWADYFNYEYAIIDNTLFIKGYDEADRTTTAFAMPIGEMPIERALKMVARHCRRNNLPLRFSVVPEDRLADFYALGPCAIEELTPWADYLYRADDLASLAGNAYSKKRNHVNRFMADNPDYEFLTLTTELLPAVKQFYDHRFHPKELYDSTAIEERRQTFHVIDNFDRLPFEGAVLMTPTNGVVAFTIGEVIGDTLYVHIEKMDHNIAGAGETINRLFARQMLQRHDIAYINREEDVADEGLRRAKQSYHPVMLLKKFDLTVG